MGSTKIIHVLKNDDFDEVFNLFKNAESEEVIFIFPKSSRFAKQGQYFEAIKREADSNGSKISIMTADAVIAEYAAQYGIKLLQTSEPRKSAAAMVAKFQQDTDKEENDKYEFKEAGYEEKPDIRLAAYKAEPRGRIIKDIVRPETEIERPIKIKEEKVRLFEVEIKKELSESHNVGSDITQVWAAREQEDGEKFIAAANFKKIKFSKILKRTPLFFIGGAIVVLMLIFYATLGNAQVIVRPQKQSLDFQLKISASSATTSVDYALNRIPGQRFAYKDGVTGEFQATGKKNVVQKANGNVIIYNKGISEQRLVATTRFKSPEGLIFRIPQTITVPAATKTNLSAQTGETLKEGSVTSIVYADKAGAEYNIDPATFTIPGFEGSPKYDQFYAKSTAPFSGGIIGPSQVVTEEDFTKAREELNGKLKEKILRSLKEQAGELKILDSISIKIESPATNVKTSEAAQSLKMTIGGYVDTLAFREADVSKLISGYVSKKGNFELLEKNLAVNYLNLQTSTDGQIMAFDVHVTGQAAVKIDQEKILKDVQGMKEDAIRNYFKNMKEVESAHVILSPFWVKSIPKDSAKIKIQINID